MDDGGNIMNDAKTVMRDRKTVLSDSCERVNEGLFVFRDFALLPFKTPAERAQMFENIMKPTVYLSFLLEGWNPWRHLERNI